MVHKHWMYVLRVYNAMNTNGIGTVLLMYLALVSPRLIAFEHPDCSSLAVWPGGNQVHMWERAKRVGCAFVPNSNLPESLCLVHFAWNWNIWVSFSSHNSTLFLFYFYFFHFLAFAFAFAIFKPFYYYYFSFFPCCAAAPGSPGPRFCVFVL